MVKSPFGDITYSREELKTLSEADGNKITLEIKKNEETVTGDDEIKAYVAALAHLKVNGKKIAKGKVKFTLGTKTTAKIKTITDKGYTVKYSFYKASSKKGTYKLMKTKDTAKIIPTKGVKGKTYYYKAVLKIYDDKGNFVTKTTLNQCDYGYAKWTAKTVK